MHRNIFNDDGSRLNDDESKLDDDFLSRITVRKNKKRTTRPMSKTKKGEKHLMIAICVIIATNSLRKRLAFYRSTRANNSPTFADIHSGLKDAEFGNDDDEKNSGEPSYIRLCQGLLEATTSGQDGGESAIERSIQQPETDDFKIVHEDPNLCINLSVKNGNEKGGSPLWTHEALLSIFGSAFLSHAFSVMMNGAHISELGSPYVSYYYHNCRKAAYIQGYLPEILIPNQKRYSESYKAQTIGLALEVCQLCTNEYSSSGKCSLFPSSGGSSLSNRDDPDGSRQLQPALGNDLRTKLTKAILPHLRISVRLASESYRNKVHTQSEGLWWAEHFVKKRAQNNLPGEDGAIIYISENDFDGDGTHLVPFYLYAERIARSTVTTIQIFVTEGCYNHKTCLTYSSSLQDFLLQMYPRALTAVDLVNPLGEQEIFGDTKAITAAQKYARMLLSSHLICATGDMECNHAAMIKNGDAYATVLLRERERVHLEELIQSNPYLTITSTDNIPTLSFHSDQDEQSAPSAQSMKEFVLQSPSDMHRCRHLRGRVGHWVQDMEYAKLAQYKTPIDYYVGKADRMFVPTEDEPFRLPTTYKWVDTLYPQCQTELVTLEGLCDVMQRLGVGRVFFLGDSLTWHMAKSLHKLLGATDGAHEGHSLKSWVASFKCPNGANEIQIQAVRNDELNKIAEEPTKKNPNCGIMGYCMPWINEYISNPVPTVLIANAGAHIDDVVRFRSVFYDFLNTVDSADRSDDIVFFRTSVPGHRDCMRRGITPFYYYHEYQARETKKWNWDMFYKHNNYVDRTLNDRAARGDAHIPIEVLDVYPMTVLRPDGHASSSDCENQCGRADDCLHYSLPGPPDWWSHLLYSNLLDLAREKEVRIR